LQFTDLSIVEHAPGSLLFGKYEVLELLGIGSSGYVYLVRHISLSNFEMALKIFYPDSDKDFKRLKSEIQASYLINHPNVIRCYEYLEDSSIAGFTMEYADGDNLKKLISDGFEDDYKAIANILIAISKGLFEIHKAGIVHRDLKPENILFTSDGTLKIADFSACLSSQEVTQGSPVGTVDYMSPEYLITGKIDKRADIYAVGAIIYQILTGDVPCQGANPYHTLKLRMEEEPTPVEFMKPDCPVILKKIVNKALQKDPENRYQCAKDLLADVKKFKSALDNNKSLSDTSISERYESLPSINYYLGFFSIGLLGVMLLSLLGVLLTQ